MQATSSVKLVSTSANQSTTKLQAKADDNQSASVPSQTDVHDPENQVETMEQASTAERDAQLSSAVNSACQSAANLNSSVVSEPLPSVALRVLESAGNVLILEPQREARLQVKPPVVQETGNAFKVQLRKTSVVSVDKLC